MNEHQVSCLENLRLQFTNIHQDAITNKNNLQQIGFREIFNMGLEFGGQLRFSNSNIDSH